MSQNKNLLLILVFLTAAFLAFAEVPTSLTYQGKLVEGGQPVDGTRAIGFRLYVDTGDDGFTGSPGDDLAWEQAPTTVSVNHGIFSWELDFAGGFSGSYSEIQDIFGAGHDLYLQVHVGPAGSAWGACTPLTPADKITSQGFAFTVADKSVTPSKLADGSSAGQLLQYNGVAWVLVDGSSLGNVASGTIDGQTSRWNNTAGQWEPSDVLTNDGTDLAVTGNLTITGEAGYSDVTDMGAADIDLAHKKYVDDLVATAGDDWGTQVVETDASLTGDGLTGTELGIATGGVNETHVDWGLAANQVGADDLPYDNTTSGLTAGDVQAALDEIADGGSANYWGVEGNDATSVASNFIGTINNTGLAFRTNDTERMRLQNSGQLTIGATAAGGKLDVHQTSANDVLRIINYGNPSNIRLRRTQGTQASPTATSGANIILGRFYAEGYDGSGYTSAAALEFVTDATGGASDDMPGRISFYTTPDGTGALEERMRIRNNGFVGINKTDPASYLDVGGDANVDGNLTVGGKLGLDGHDPAPAGAVGEIYVNSADGKLYYHNGTIWEEVATGDIATTLQDAYDGGNTIATAVDADPVVINAGGSGAEALYVGGTGGGNAIKTNGHLWMETGNIAMDDGHINVTDAYNGGSVLSVEQTGTNRVATFSNNAMSMSPAVYINNSGGSYALQTSGGNVVVDNGALWLDGLARIDGEVIVRDASDATTFYVNNATGQTEIEGKLAVRESGADVFNVDGTSGQIWTAGDIYSEGMIHVQESGSDVATIHGTSGDFWTRGSIYFEGTTEDVNETRLTVVDPTAPRTITFPNESGTVLLDATLSENDPVVAGQTGIIISDGTTISSIANNSANWNTAFSWGDHSIVGYLTSADLADYWNTSDFTATDISNWNTAYGWGDHSAAGYLTSETDPIFNAWLATPPNVSVFTNDAGYITSGDVAGTNIAQGTRTATTVPVTSSTGTDATLEIATTALAGVMSAADKTKLDGIEAGATGNQDIELTGDDLGLTGSAVTVDLSPYLDNTDNQNLSHTVSGTDRTINISGGTGTTISVADNDNDATNELQTIAGSGTSAFTLSDGGGTITLDGTGGVGITRSGNTLTIDASSAGDNWGSGTWTVTDGTTPSTVSEGQAVTFVGSGATSVSQLGRTVTISSTDNVNDADSDPTNELITAASYTHATNTLRITEAGTDWDVDLSALDNSGTDSQNLSVGAGTGTTSLIQLTGSANDVTLQAGSNVTLSEAGNTITIASTDNDTWQANTQAQNGYVTAGGANNNMVWKTDGSGNPSWRADNVNDADSDPTNELQTLGISGNDITLTDGGSVTVPYATTAGSAPPSGTAGGDLSGTYPDPTVDGIQGRSVAMTAPTNGQVLKWNSTASQWEPSADATGSDNYVTGASVSGTSTKTITLTRVSGGDVTANFTDNNTEYTAGTGIDITGTTINNTAPDQTVALSAGTGISVAGTYPNFTITNTSPSSGGTVTSVTASSPLFSSGGTTPNITIQVANGTQNGYLSSTNWNTFNEKLESGDNISELVNDEGYITIADVVGTNIAQGTRTATTVPVTSSTGSDATLNIATTDLAGVMSAADKTKLDGIEAGATGNQDIELTGDDLGLTGSAVTVDLSPYMDNTDNQNLSHTVSGTDRTINISGGTGTTISVADNDNDASNELQTIAGSGTSAFTLSDGGGTITLDGTGGVGITRSGNTLTIDASSAGDNWGTQVAQTNARLAGNGTLGSPLDIAQQGATGGQVLKWNGSSWAPAGDNNTTYSAGTAIDITGTTISNTGVTSLAAGTGINVSAATGAVTVTNSAPHIGTNIAQGTRTATTVPVTSSTGTDATLDIATTAVAGVMSADDKTKLDGIANNANNYSHPDHTGDVTSSGDGATVISNNAVTYAKMQTVSAQRLLGNPTASAAVPSEITVSTGLNLSVAGVLTATGSGGTVTNIATNNGITGGPITGTGTIGLTGQALNLHNMGTNGFFYRNGGTIGARSIAVSGNGISIANGTGAAGNPTISLNIGTGATQVAAGNHGHTNMVTGTGTAGYTARWATSATLEASSIQDNGAGNIGINRSPSATYRLVTENASNAKAYLAGNTWGVYGEGDGAGVYGVTGSGPPYTYGILGHGSLSCGVYGSSPTYGVRGNSLTGTGVYGEGSTNGVYGSGTTTGVRGEGSTYGVRGEGTYGVYGSGTVGTTRYGVYGTASGGTINWAGYFNGNMATNGYINIQNITAPGAGNRLYANSGNLYWDGTLLNTGGATPGGANTQVQYNNSGTFAGSADFTWNNSTKVLTVGGANPITINGATGKIDCKTVDPVIEIEGEKYATYNWDGIGLRTDVVGVAQLTNGEFRVDMAKQPKASDLWLFYHAVAETSIIPFVTAQDPAILMARVEGSELVVRSISGEENARFSYRLSGVRIDMVGSQEEINIRTDDPFPHIKVSEYDKNGTKLK